MHTSTGQESVSYRWAERRPDLPFLATIFHTVGLNVMDPREIKRDVLDVSTRALRDMAATSWLRTEPPHSMHGRKIYVHLFVTPDAPWCWHQASCTIRQHVKQDGKVI